MSLSGKLVTAATVPDTLHYESLLRWAFVAHVAVVWSYVGVTALFYEMFRPVSRVVSLAAACFSLVGCAVLGLGCVLLLAPVSGSIGAPVGSPEELRVFAGLVLRLHAQAFNASMVFFGWYCLLIGYLVFRASFLPRVLGVLLAIAGLGWLTFLSPPLVRLLSPYILIPGLVGEGSLTLWLLIRGVNVAAWREQCRAAAL